MIIFAYEYHKLIRKCNYIFQMICQKDSKENTNLKSSCQLMKQLQNN